MAGEAPATLLTSGGTVEQGDISQLYTPPIVPGQLDTWHNTLPKAGNDSTWYDDLEASTWTSAWTASGVSGIPEISGPTVISGMTAYSWTTTGGLSTAWSYQSLYPGIRLTKGLMLRFGARVKLQTTQEVIVGLCGVGTTPFTLISNGLWFYKAQGSTDVSLRRATGAASTADYETAAGAHGITNDRWYDITLDIQMDPVRDGYGDVDLFLNGSPVAGLRNNRVLPYSAELVVTFGAKHNGTFSLDRIGRIARGAMSAPHS
jgi:hypothetical protein